jgi:LuxR family transcriptional regulator, maltose regulon positive regulatory protein
MTLSEPSSPGRAAPAAAPRVARQDTVVPLDGAKLEAPRVRPGLITRQRLVRPLAARPGPSLAALFAPPGYGKTTLLAQLAAAERRPVAWLTIDELDNDPAVLVSYLSAALDRVEPPTSASQPAGPGSGPRGRHPARPGASMARLATRIHEWRDGGVLVIDDVHRLTDRACLDMLASLIDHLPDGFRVAIAGRSQPELPLARIRAAGELLEVGIQDLALTSAEVTKLVRAAGCELGDEAISEITSRTEGWPTGVYLATLALARSPSDEETPRISGGDGFIAEYLRSEFHDGLDPDDATFLRRTAILERLTPALAEEVSQLPKAAKRLRRLAESNLLIQHVPGDQQRYRFHNLMRDFLVAELEVREPGTAAGLHRRAADWYEAADRADLAIEHLIAAGDADAAARQVSASALRMYVRGQALTVDRWLAAFDPATFERQPPFAVSAAWIHIVNGRTAEAERMADIADRVQFHGRPSDGSASFTSQRAMLRAIMARNGPRDALSQAKVAVSLERPGSPWRATALFAYGSLQQLLGNVQAADESYAKAAAESVPQAWAMVMLALTKRASLALNRGDFAIAHDFITEAEEMLAARGHRQILHALLVHAVSARISIRAGDQERGRDSLVRAQLVRPVASHSAPWFSVEALLELCRAYLAVSDPAGAQQTLREAERIVRRRPALGTLTADLVTARKLLESSTTTLAGSSTLTAAELRVLPLLPTYLSFQDIAERLTISRNTVKTHAMSIYGKLWATSRGEAVERAIEIGLLEAYPALSKPMAAAVDGVNGQVDDTTGSR